MLRDFRAARSNSQDLHIRLMQNHLFARPLSNVKFTGVEQPIRNYEIMLAATYQRSVASPVPQGPRR